MMGFPLPPWWCPPVWRQREKERRLAGKAGMLNKIAQTIRLWASIPEGIAVGIFIGGLEGLFFQMVPIKWMDGHRLWSWNKLVWLGVTGITAFLFWHILLNAESQSFDTLSKTTPAIAMLLMGLCFGMTLAMYLFFRIKNRSTPSAA